MLSPRILTTLFCQNLLHPSHTPLYSHLTLHVPLRTIAGYYRSRSDGHHSTLAFCIAPMRCLGHCLEELDNELYTGPRLFSWLTLGEYQAHKPEPIPESVSWGVLLQLFATVDVITDHTMHTSSGQTAATNAPYMNLYRIFD